MSWRAISQVVLLIMIYGLIAVILVSYHQPLRWSVGALEQLMQGRIITESPENILYKQAENSYTMAGDIGQVLFDVERALIIDPYYIDSLYLKATALNRLNIHDQAWAAWQRIITIDPSQKRAYLLLSTSLEKAGQHERAEIILRRGIVELKRLEQGVLPRPNTGARKWGNHKVIHTYKTYGEDLKELRQALDELTGRRQQPAVPLPVKPHKKKRPARNKV